MDDDDQAQEEDSEDESATPVFNVDRLKAETKTPFRTVCCAVRVVLHYIYFLRRTLDYDMFYWQILMVEAM